MFRTAFAVSLVVATASLVPQPSAAQAEALAKDAPWRVFLVCRLPDRDARKPAQYTPAPPADWTQPDLDDSGWGRYGSDVYANIGGYGYGQSAQSHVLCLRARFGVSDPAQARDLTLSLEYRGGVLVYVNGQEIARRHLPTGLLTNETLAEAYPPEAFVNTSNSVLPAAERPATENADRYEARIRRLTVTLPATALRKGANALAIELRAAPPGKVQGGGRTEWSTVGLCDAKLTSASGAGVVAYADALAGPTLANATPMDTVSVAPGKRQAGFLWWNITITPAGLTRGNPFDPLRPIRTVAPRGGTASGQVVVSGPGPLSGLTATLSPLKHASGATLPAEAARVAFATQGRDEVFCNALLPKPVDGAPVQPVWVLVDVPRDQAPGWYTGELAVAVGGRSWRVPVQVLVAAWTLTDPRDNATFVSLYQSPDTLAEQFKVAPWSDAHFALIEQSMRTMALAGSDVLLVPVVSDNYLHHKTGLIRWTRKGEAWEPEFSAFERYLDLHTKVFGKPKVVTLSVWKHDFGTRTWFRGMRSDVVKPCMVTELDPATGAMKPAQAPHFGEPGSEAFWKSMIEGARRIVKARGLDDRFLLLGEAFDSRPLEAHRQFFETIQPGMRWQIYSHFDGGEPPVKAGKFVCHGGFEVGFRINPNGGSLPEFSREWPKVATNEFLVAQCERTEIHHTSSPLSYRWVMRTSGTIARIGLDFWPIYEERGRLRGYYGCPPNEGWLWRGHVPALTAPGPDGGVRTTRGQMFLEGLQEAEAFVVFQRERRKASPELVARIDRCLGDRHWAGSVGRALSQACISMDLPGLAAREYAVAAELAGSPAGDADWSKPPAVPGAAR
jgi:hypothetical protein